MINCYVCINVLQPKSCSHFSYIRSVECVFQRENYRNVKAGKPECDVHIFIPHGQLARVRIPEVKTGEGQAAHRHLLDATAMPWGFLLAALLACWSQLWVTGLPWTLGCRGQLSGSGPFVLDPLTVMWSQHFFRVQAQQVLASAFYSNF